ncbi:MAG: imm11 family protein [Pirellulales bacterium]
MKWYCMIETTDEDGVPPYPLLAGDEDLFGHDYSEFKRGQLVDGWNPNSLIRAINATYDGRADDVLGTVGHFPVFSERLRVALADEKIALADIQYLPIRVFRTTGEELPGFAVANVVARVAALDADRSFMLKLDYDQIDHATGKPKVKSFGRAALWEEPLRGHDAIRLLESSFDVFVSQRFVKVFTSHGFTGARFNPVTVS